MTVTELFKNIRQRLATLLPESEARETAILIFENLKNWTLTDLLVKGDEEVTQWLIDKANSVTDRILNHEPIQYIFGNAHFYGMRLTVTPDVLIPRQETAQLVDIIVDDFKNRQDLHVLDIATGSGCIAIALSRNLKFANVDATDISAKALDVAIDNAKQLKANVNFKKADILDLPDNALPTYDIIVSNPPYIALKEAQDMDDNVLEHEPHEALFVPDDDPLKYYLPISRYSLSALRKSGKLYFEINPVYAAMLTSEMKSIGWNNVDVVRDMQGKQRFIIASL